MSRKLGRRFFNRPTIKVARDLLGCYLVRKIGNKVIRVRITETEGYIGPNDRASHASRGRPPRTKIMFGNPGYFYIYLIYGMYYCLNVVTEKRGFPAAVLIRAVTLKNNNGAFCPRWDKKPAGDFGAKITKTDGPGKLCRYFKVDKSLNNKDSVTSQQLWFEGGKLLRTERIMSGKRIGVSYAGVWQHKPWRFYIKIRLSKRRAH